MRVLGLLLLAVAAAALAARFTPASNRWILAGAALSPYLMLGAPLAVLAFGVSRHWTLVSVAAVLTVVVLAVQAPRYIGSPAPDTGAALRFVSANLLLGEADPAAVTALAAEHADILAMQELTPELSAALSRALAADFPYSALRPRDRAAGVGLWSRYPITASGSDESFTRGLIYARVQVPGVDAETIVLSTHMPPPRSAFASWRTDITRLGPALRELPDDGPIVIGADLNASPDVREFRQLLTDGYRDGAAQAGAGLDAHARHVVVGGADPQRRVPALAQPMRQPDVVGVHVRDQHAQDGQAVQLVGKHFFPLLARFGLVNAAVHHRPARDGAARAVQLIAQQPQIDVVERKGQTHAQPFHTGGHLHGASGCGQGVAQGVVQLLFEGVHGRWFLVHNLALELTFT